MMIAKLTMMTMTTVLFPAALVGSLTCLVLLFQPISAEELANSNFFHVTEWHGKVPTLSTFATYADMNDYIASRASRRLRHLANPTDDSYIEAFNQHNEQATEELSKARPKRQALERKLPNEPRLLQFDVSDAVEPNEETKRLIQKHRTRETSQLTAKFNSTRTNPTVKKSARSGTRLTNVAVDFGTRVRVRRSKRSSAHNFKVELIPFQASDAREPDEETRKLIKRMRSLELEKLERTQATSSPLPPPRIPPARPSVQPSPITSTALPSVLPTLPQQPGRRSKAGKLYTKSPRKRTRRAINQQTAPKMIKFELEDAKEPDESMKALISLSRESKEIKANTLQDIEAEKNNATTRLVRKSDSPEVGAEIDDQNSEESRRFLIYKESPMKVKKSINSLPHDVQKVITHFMKDSQGAKAYIKYLPAQQMDYNQLRTVTYNDGHGAAPNYQGPKAAGASGGAYVNYIQPPPQPQSQPKQVQLQIQSVPVVEKMRYIYTPIANAATVPLVMHQQPYLPQHSVAVSPAPIQQHLIAEPIVVPESEYVKQAAPQLTEVHHTYAADLSYANEQGKAEAPPIQHVQQASVDQFHGSRLDPYLEENKIVSGEAAAAAEAELIQEQQQIQLQQQQQLQQVKQQQQQQQNSYTIPVENYKYELFSKSPQVPQGYVTEFSNSKQQQRPQQELQVGPVAASHQEATPLIKIEYHGPPDSLKENYKQMTEFKELSALMGKSPEDQIHGLTYLLAKEMQSKLKQKRQQKSQLDQLRPQDNTSPVLFHPPDYEALEAKIPPAGAEQANLYAQSGRLIGMGKSKQYIPIIEQLNSKSVAASSAEAFEQQQQLLHEGGNGGAKSGSEISAPTSFVHYDLTHNYRRGAKDPKSGLAGAGISYMPDLQGKKQYSYDASVFTGSGVGGHGAGGRGGAVGSGNFGGGVGGVGSYIGGSVGGSIGGAKLQLGAGAGAGAMKLNGALNFQTQIDERDPLQYASKYAFGYRVRDFNSGNDFGHKQHRDLDGVTRGQYHILLPDGRIQNVIYHADGTGFHADVSFESGH